MSIDKDSEKNISQILTNVRQQSSDPGYSGRCTTSQASGWSDVPSQPSSSSGLTEHCDWYVDEKVPASGQTHEGMECMEQDQSFSGQQQHGFASQGLSQASRGCTSGEFSAPSMTTATPPSWDVVDAGVPLAIPAPPHVMGGATVTGATPTGSAEMDKRLLDELMEAISTNERYKRMLVRRTGST